MNRFFIFLTALLFSIHTSEGKERIVSAKFNYDDFEMRYNNSGELEIIPSANLYSKNYSYSEKVGGLPFMQCHVAIPRNTTYNSMSVSSNSRLVMENVVLAQNTNGQTNNTDALHLENTKIYPSSCAEYIRTHITEEVYTFLYIRVCPFEYDVQNKKLYFHDKIILNITLDTPNPFPDQFWTMAVTENGDESPVIRGYQGVHETVENDKDYYRIYENYQYSLNHGKSEQTARLPYGYRQADKQIYIYDYENQKETLAFDFNLAVGEHFTTFNGMEWVVESVKDTIVNISYCRNGESVSKKLLTVETLDGSLTDQWLEDFGSFTNHFMINSLDNVKYSQTLWMEYDYGEYLAREISIGPIFGHDSGFLGFNKRNNVDDLPYKELTYKDGQVVFEDVQWWCDHRDYVCFYRNEDDIYEIYRWEMDPLAGLTTSAFSKDVITFQGLPAPASGKYTIHIGEEEYSTGVDNVRMTSQSKGGIYDLQGRKLLSQPSKGLYISDGQKIYAR